MSPHTWVIHGYDPRNGCISDPCFTAAKYEGVSILFGGRFHSRRVRPMVRLREPKTTDEFTRRCTSMNKKKIIDWQGAHLISVNISLSALEYQTR